MRITMTTGLWRQELDSLPERVAARVRERIEYLAALAREGASSALELATRELLAYARSGHVRDWASTDDARAALRVVSLACAAPLGGALAPEDWVDRVDLEGELAELAEVCRAVLARVCLAEGRAVPRTWLAALAGASRSLVDKYARLGKLKRAAPRARASGAGKPSRDVTADSARRWLRARAVEGVA
jgi:hypothetical protein